MRGRLAIFVRRFFVVKICIISGIAGLAICEVSPDIPIIAFSVVVFETDRQAALNAGCNDFIAKHFEEEACRINIRIK